LVASYRNRAQARVRQLYDWEHVVDRYEQLFAEMAGQPLPAPRETDAATPATEHAAARNDGASTTPSRSRHQA
jgi:hypothetical protein